MYKGGLQCFYYIFSFSPFLLTWRHSPGNSKRNSVSCPVFVLPRSCCILCQTQLLHSVHFIIYARSPSSMWEPRAKLRSHSSCPPGASIHGTPPRMGPLHLQHACQRPCSHASEHRRNHTHNQNKLPSSAWFMYLFWEEICFTTIRRKTDASKHRSEKHIIIGLVCTKACSWIDGPGDVLS